MSGIQSCMPGEYNRKAIGVVLSCIILSAGSLPLIKRLDVAVAKTCNYYCVLIVSHVVTVTVTVEYQLKSRHALHIHQPSPTSELFLVVLRTLSAA